MTLKYLIRNIISEKYDSLGYNLLQEKKRGTSIISPDAADASGKAFELHVAKHIGHIINGEKGHPDDHHPEHFSDESGDAPHISLAKQRKKLGDHINNKIDRDARRMAHHILNHIHKHAGISLRGTNSKVYWTSKPNDLERLTGKKGIKGTSDIVIHHEKTYHGVSLKYSNSGSNPSLRSPGIEDLNKHLKADSHHVANISSQHDKEVHAHVGHLVGQGSKKEKHQKFKALVASGGSGAASAGKALEASKSAHKKLALHYSDSFNKLPHEHKAHFIRKMNDAEEQPTIKPYRASYDGARGVSKVTNPTNDFDEIHKKTKHYEAENLGASVHIHAVLHDGTKKKVCSFGIKNKSSSPYSSFAGRVSDTSSNKTTVKKVKRIVKKKK